MSFFACSSLRLSVPRPQSASQIWAQDAHAQAPGSSYWRSCNASHSSGSGSLDPGISFSHTHKKVRSHALLGFKVQI